MIYKCQTEDMETVVSSKDFEKVHRFYRDLIHNGFKATFTSEPEFHDAHIEMSDDEIFLTDYWNGWVSFEVYLTRKTKEKRVMIRFADEDNSGVDVPYKRFIELLTILKEC